MKVTTDCIRELRDQSGAGIMDCRKALLETEGNMEKALEILKEQSLFKAEKKAVKIEDFIAHLNSKKDSIDSIQSLKEL